MSPPLCPCRESSPFSLATHHALLLSPSPSPTPHHPPLRPSIPFSHAASRAASAMLRRSHRHADFLCPSALAGISRSTSRTFASSYRRDKRDNIITAYRLQHTVLGKAFGKD